MAGIVGSLLEEDPDTSVVPEQNKSGTLISGLLDGSNEEARLSTSLNQAVAKQPDQQARIMRLQLKTGLAPDLIERNLDQVERESSKSDFDAKKFRKESPLVSGWLAENPEHMAVARDDLSNLTGFEWLFKAPRQAFKEGQEQVELGHLGYKQMIGEATDEEIARISELETKIGTTNYGAEGWFENAAIEAGKLLPAMVGSLEARVKTGLITGMATGTTAALASAIFPPAEIVTVPVAFTGGAAAGFTLGSADYSFRSESGLAFREFSKIEGLNGEKLDPKVAAIAASMSGAMNAGLETFAFDTLLKSIPGGKNITSAIGRDAIKAALKNPTFVSALTGAAAKYGRVVSTEVATEVLQETSTILAGEIAKSVDKGEFEGATAEEITERLSQTLIKTAQGVSLLGAPGPVANFYLDTAKARSAKKNQDKIIALGDSAKASKLRERLPEKYQEFAARVRDKGTVDNVYVPLERWNEFFQSEGIDPANMAAEVTGSQQAYNEASAAGGDVAIPLDRYAARIAGSDLHEKLAPDIRFNPDDMTLREAEEFEASAPDIIQRYLEEAGAVTPAGQDTSAAVYEDVLGQLLGSGVERGAADKQAQLVGKVFSVLGQRTGQDPSELYAQYGLKISREIPEILKPFTRTDTGLDPLIDRLRAGDIPSQQDIFGESLLQFLRQQGGLRDEGGELAARDAQLARGKPGERRLVSEAGIPLDGAAELAAEAGYITDRNPDELLAAIDQELGGQEVFRLGSENAQLLTVREALSRMDEELSQAGVDLAATDNETIKAILRGEARQERVTDEATQEFNQADDQIGQQSVAENATIYTDALPEQSEVEALRAQVEDLKEQLRTDHKTGLRNDKAFLEDEALGWSTVAAFDLDGFKKLNSALAHELVDKSVLKPLADLFLKAEQDNENIRIYRRGGDEFAVRLNADAEAADKFMLDLQDRLDSIGIDITVKDHRNGQTKTYTLDGIGISYGVASNLGEETYEAADQNAEQQKLERLRAGKRDDPRSAGAPRRLRETTENTQERRGDGQGVQPSRRAGERRQGQLELLQQQGGKKRGRIRFTTRSRLFEIQLLENANLSTFLHESGHFYLEVIGDLAGAENAPQQIKDDYQQILNWFGVTSRDQIKTEHHEKFARGFEAFLMEGKAPTAELQSLFSRFQAWLTQIYKTISALNVDLTPEVRQVFDRLVATDDEIKASNEALNYTAVGLFGQDFESDQEFTAYQKAIADEKQEAQQEITAQAMREITREQRQWWQDERARVRKDVEAEINAMPAYMAMHFLQKGELPGGGPLPDGWKPVKLSKNALVDAYGQDFIKRLPRPFIYTREGGVAPEQVAALFGFDSGDAMIQELVNAKPRVKAIEAETNARMEQKYGNILTDGSLPEKAMAAAHNTKRADVMLREIKILSKKTSRGPAGTSLQIMRAAAQRIISQKKVRDINPSVYRSAEAKFARAAFEAVGAKDYDTALQAKHKQLLNHELYKQARDAKEQIDSTVNYMRSFERKSVREKIGKAGADYLQQIDSFLQRFSFSRVTNRQLDKKKALADWISEKEGQGYHVTITEELKNEALSVSYKELPYQQLIGIRDTVKNIEHIARLKNKLMANQKHQQLEDAVDSIVSSIAANHDLTQKPVEISPRFGSMFKKGWSKYDAAHTKMEFLFEYLDGSEVGTTWESLFKPLTDAENQENGLIKEASKRMNAIFDAYTRTEKAMMHVTRTHIPEIDQSLTKASMLTVALNWGNVYNRDVLMQGYGWSESQVQAILNKLDKRDWEVVQGIWDFLDSYWKDVAALQKEMTGLIPEKVEAAEVVTQFGTFKGGYYPLKYNAEWSFTQHQFDEKANVNALYGNNWVAPATKKGHTIERNNSGGKKILLDFSVLTGHISNVVHDLTHRKAIMDVDRIIQHPKVTAAIEAAAGRDMHRQLRPWLQAIASDSRQPAGPFEAIAHHARMGATIVGMAWKISTAILQPLGYTNSMHVLGEKYGWTGLQKFYLGNPVKMAEKTKWVLEQSEMMRDRQRTFDRDVRDMLKTFTLTGQMAPVQKSFFYLTGLMDMSVAIPTWLGAYQKAMDGAAENVTAGDKEASVAFADSVVRRSQSAGGVKDLAAIQRGSEYHRIFTLFYSFFSAQYNLFKRAKQMTHGISDIPKFAAGMFYLWFVPAIMSELIVGRGPDDDDEWAEWAAKKLIMYPAQSLIGIRDIVNGMSDFGYEPSPVFDAFESIVKNLKSIGKAFDPGDELGKSDVKDFLMTAGYWAHLPARQMWITGSYLYDWMTGEESPESIGEAMRNLALSRNQ